MLEQLWLIYSILTIEHIDCCFAFENLKPSTNGSHNTSAKPNRRVESKASPEALSI
jgi:hypothetical protein